MIVLFIVVPLIIPVVYSFSTLWLDLLPEGLTLRWYRTLVEHPKYRTAALVSLNVAAAAVAMNVILCVPAAYALNRLMRRGKQMVGAVVQILPLVCPPLVIGTALLQGFSGPPWPSVAPSGW